MIVTKKLTKTYRLGDQKIDVLRGITLSIDKGEFVALMGPSGSGKSTLMNLLGCLDSPTDGSYLLDGENVEDKSDDELAEIRNGKIGFIFQTFNLLPKLSAIENVSLPSLYGPEDEMVRAKQILVKVGLEDRMHHKPNELSGGQRQRVAIARALLMDPPILFADEPTGNLDSKSSAEIMEIFRDLSKEGKTIIMVTHDPDIAANAHRVIHLKDGMIVSKN
jgi:putative ABC transport system ATP-binding protein